MIETLLFIFTLKVHSSGCYDQNDQPVQYFSIIKYPESNQQQQDYKFSLFTSGSQQMVQQSIQIDHEDGPLSRTFTKVQSSLLAWNDLNPENEKTQSYGAHSKGIIHINEKSNQGFLIVHSIPGWPMIQDEKIDMTLIPRENVYGQSIICISLNGEQIDQISKGIMITRPQVYYNSIKKSKFQTLELFFNKLDRKEVQDLDEHLTTNISIGNTQLKSYFKNPNYDQSILDIISNDLKSSLLVESWGRPYNPDTKNVKNIETVKFQNVEWTHSQDHSKWFITTTNSWICIGDMNNMDSQKKRGGGFHCLNDVPLYREFQNSIKNSNVGFLNLE